ncbi:MAG: DNA-binding protein WhiA [Eubacteriales bacterium]
MESFASTVKKELCRAPINRPCCALAEGLGVLLFCNTFHGDEIRILTEHEGFATRLPQLFLKGFSVTFDQLPSGNGKFRFVIKDKEKLKTIVEKLGGERDGFSCQINFAYVEEECCRTAFCRGAFLAGGAVSDPVKGYHLELVTSHLSVSRQFPALLHESGFSPKTTQRKGHFMSYFKKSSEIEDFLSVLGAPISAMEIMNAKLEKDLKRDVNRRLNCEMANLDKTVDATLQQIEIISQLEKMGILDTLPEKLQQTASLRVEYPEYTLSKLADCFSPPISKSALSHRLRKLQSYL